MAKKRLVMALFILLILPMLVYAVDEPDLEVVGYELYAMNRTVHEVPIEEEVWIKVLVENDGDEEADNVEVRVIFEETGINTTVEVGDIDAGDTELSKKVMVTDDSGDDSIDETGTYYFTFIVDPEDDIEESDEDNNERNSGSGARIKFYDPSCGDDYCDGGEDSDDCCEDCGCPSGEECDEDENECILSNACERDSDCDDNDVSTNGECSGDPKECHYFKITSCTDDDGYCPIGCTFDEDDDCHECLHDTNCDDDKASTKDTCTGTPMKCKHTAITTCTDGDGYCPLKCDHESDDDCNKPAVCGDGECADNETKSNCCKDCGCDEDYECKDNKCKKTEEQIARDAIDDNVKLTVMKDRLENDGYDMDHFSMEDGEAGGYTFTYSYLNDDGNEVQITGTVTSAGNVKNLSKTGEKSYALQIIGLLGIVFVVGVIIMIALHMRGKPHTGYVREETHHPRHEPHHHAHTSHGLFAKEAPPHLHEKIQEWIHRGASEEKIKHHLHKKYSKEDVAHAMKKAKE